MFKALYSCESGSFASSKSISFGNPSTQSSNDFRDALYFAIADFMEFVLRVICFDSLVAMACPSEMNESVSVRKKVKEIFTFFGNLKFFLHLLLKRFETLKTTACYRDVK